jgi:hypothetical protein
MPKMGTLIIIHVFFFFFRFLYFFILFLQFPGRWSILSFSFFFSFFLFMIYLFVIYLHFKNPPAIFSPPFRRLFPFLFLPSFLLLPTLKTRAGESGVGRGAVDAQFGQAGRRRGVVPHPDACSSRWKPASSGCSCLCLCP